MKNLHVLAFILLIIGGLNWLLTGLIPGWDLGEYVTGGVARVVYILVGLAALYEAATHTKGCRQCEVKSAPAPTQPQM